MQTFCLANHQESLHPTVIWTHGSGDKGMNDAVRPCVGRYLFICLSETNLLWSPAQLLLRHKNINWNFNFVNKSKNPLSGELCMVEFIPGYPITMHNLYRDIPGNPITMHNLYRDIQRKNDENYHKPSGQVVWVNHLYPNPLIHV